MIDFGGVHRSRLARSMDGIVHRLIVQRLGMDCEHQIPFRAGMREGKCYR